MNTRKDNYAKRLLYAIIGLLMTGLAILGAVVPVLPTTVFVLIALWAFSNASERLHGWFIRLPLLRTALVEAKKFQQEKTVALSAKIISQVSAWGSSIVLILVTRSLVIGVASVAVAISCSMFMFLTPTRKSNTAPVNSDAV
jgi:uncharacterized membrane protein YbaN (DUF454 family)